MSDQTQSLIRTVLKVLSGVLIAKGIGDATAWEEITGGIVGVVGVVLSYYSAKQKTVLKKVVSGQLSVDHPDVRAIVPKTPGDSVKEEK